MIYIKYLIFGGLLLFLFHFESLHIFGVKISHLWKGVLLFFLLIEIIKRKTIHRLYIPYILLAILQIINVDIFYSTFNNIVNCATIIILPLIGIYVLRYNETHLKFILMFFSTFYILSFVPYQLGILSSFGEGYNLTPFGGEIGLVGPYQNPHGASISLASALLVILFFWFSGEFNRILLSVVFIMGLTFLIYTYVRTGLAMFIVGTLPIVIFYGIKNNSNMVKLIIFLFFIGLVSINFIVENEVFVNRITGHSKYNTETNFEKMGSGRGEFLLIGFEVFRNAGIIEKTIGVGRRSQVYKFKKKTGMTIGSHNAFMDLLLVNGLIGLLCFLFYLSRIVCFIRSRRSDYSILSQSLFLSYLTMSFFQGYEWLSANLLLMVSLALVNNNSKKFGRYKRQRYRIMF